MTLSAPRKTPLTVHCRCMFSLHFSVWHVSLFGPTGKSAVWEFNISSAVFILGSLAPDRWPFLSRLDRCYVHWLYDSWFETIYRWCISLPRHPHAQSTGSVSQRWAFVQLYCKLLLILAHDQKRDCRWLCIPCWSPKLSLSFAFSSSQFWGAKVRWISPITEEN